MVKPKPGDIVKFKKIKEIKWSKGRISKYMWYKVVEVNFIKADGFEVITDKGTPFYITQKEFKCIKKIKRRGVTIYENKQTRTF